MYICTKYTTEQSILLGFSSKQNLHLYIFISLRFQIYVTIHLNRLDFWTKMFTHALLQLRTETQKMLFIVFNIIVIIFHQGLCCVNGIFIISI